MLKQHVIRDMLILLLEGKTPACSVGAHKLLLLDVNIKFNSAVGIFRAGHDRKGRGTAVVPHTLLCR